MDNHKKDKTNWKESNISNAFSYYDFLSFFLTSNIKEIINKTKNVIVSNNYFLDYSEDVYNSDKNVQEIVDVSYSLEHKLLEGRRKMDKLLKDRSSIFFNGELYDMNTLIKNTHTLKLDSSIYSWLEEDRRPTEDELNLATYVIAERLLPKEEYKDIKKTRKDKIKEKLRNYLLEKGYFEEQNENDDVMLEKGTFSLSSPLFDLIIKPKTSKERSLPIFFDIRNGREYVSIIGKKIHDGEKIKKIEKKYKKHTTYILILSGFYSYETLRSLKFCNDWIWENELKSSLDMLNL